MPAGDTLFIVLWKKKLTFVHWYHHLVVLILAWYGYKNLVAGLGWNTALNLSIHCLTHCYYTVTAMGIWVPTSIAMLITTSQMAQMTGFVILNIFVFFWKDDKLCHINCSMLILATSFSVTLLALFSNFFIKTFLSSIRKSKGD